MQGLCRRLTNRTITFHCFDVSKCGMWSVKYFICAMKAIVIASDSALVLTVDA